MNKKHTFLLLLLLCGSLLQSLHATVGEVLEEIQQRAHQSQTEALLILRNGKPIFSYPDSTKFPRFECQEMMRPLLALAIGILVDERYISSLDTPIATFCPAWEAERPSPISIRALLADDGLCFFQLEEVIQAITHENWHDYLQIKLFTPLGISGECWKEKEGAIELHLTAAELANIGQLIIRKGEWNGKRLLSERWIRALQRPITQDNPFASMQWSLEYYDLAAYWDQELLDCYRCNKLSPPLIDRLSQLNGRVIHLGGLAIRGHLVHAWGPDIFCSLGGQSGLQALVKETYSKKLPFGNCRVGGIKSMIAWGRGGQQLIIVPSKNLIAVRQTRHLHEHDSFEDLIEKLDDYAVQCDCYID